MKNKKDEINDWQEKIEKKLATRQKKQKPKMKVSGRNVLTLKKIIIKKAKKS